MHGGPGGVSPAPLAEAAAAHFREQLAASGTGLYVIDASPRRDPGDDTLAAESGGRAIRVRSAAEWSGAFSRVVSDLGEQRHLCFTRLPAARTGEDPRPDPALYRVRNSSAACR